MAFFVQEISTKVIEYVWRDNIYAFQAFFYHKTSTVCIYLVLRIVGREFHVGYNLGNDHGFIGKEYCLLVRDILGKLKVESLCLKWTISYHYGELWFITWRVMLLT